MNLATTVWIVLLVIKILGVSTVPLSWFGVFAIPVLIFYVQWICLSVWIGMRNALVEHRLEKARKQIQNRIMR